MTTTENGSDWRVVDAGWGHAAADFATLSEPSNCREYVALHHLLAVDGGDQLLDMACGALPFAWEFADPEAFARALASTGPAYEAIQHAGATAFHDVAVAAARSRIRDGLPLRAQLPVVAYVARKAVDR